MKNILIIGAGRSATALINYTLKEAEKHNWFVTVADADPEVAEQKVGGHAHGRGTWLDVMKPNDRRDIIERNDVVVSLLPAHLHIKVAKDCIKYKKHLVTASYISRDMYRLGEQVKSAELIFMGEMGLDPGIDHMSAMQTINELREKGAELTAFRSYAGGLIAPESDNNPWHYKFTWNPRNVVLAGQGTAQYIEDGHYKHIPYHRLFSQYELIDVPGMGEYEAYLNRSSLLYRTTYGLEKIPSLLRGTLRCKGYCDAWNALVQIGLTDDTYPIIGSKNLTYHQLVDGYLPRNQGNNTLKERVAKMLKIDKDSDVIKKLEWLGIFDRSKIGLIKATPAQILQHLLQQKWTLESDDKDMIIMQHEFDYKLNGKSESLISTMVLEGNDSVDTAMSRLVGLPLGIFVKLIMLGKIKSTGVNIPVMEEVYTPVLKELEDYGVIFKETIR